MVSLPTHQREREEPSLGRRHAEGNGGDGGLLRLFRAFAESPPEQIPARRFPVDKPLETINIYQFARRRILSQGGAAGCGVLRINGPFRRQVA